jgi:hypothetical protein
MARVLLVALAAFIAAHSAAALRPTPPMGLTAPDPAALRFRRDSNGHPSFKILQITDLHYGEDSDKDEASTKVPSWLWIAAAAAAALAASHPSTPPPPPPPPPHPTPPRFAQLQQLLLEAERPDLVVLSGDLVSGWLGNGSAGWFERHWHALSAPVQSYGAPYAIILGNHDDQADLSREEIVDLILRTGGPFSATQPGPPGLTGATNYFLDLLPPEGDDPVARLWLLDSMDTGCGGLPRSWCAPGRRRAGVKAGEAG